MKKIDLNRKFKDFKGREIGMDTISDELSKALFNGGAQGLPIKEDDKYRAYKLSTRLIAQNGIVELSDEDAAFLETFCSFAFAAGAYGQIMDLLKQ